MGQTRTRQLGVLALYALMQRAAGATGVALLLVGFALCGVWLLAMHAPSSTSSRVEVEGRLHRHLIAAREGFGWRDCTGKTPSQGALRKAYRSLSKQTHPDLDRSRNSEEFHALTGARAALSDPLQYQLYREAQNKTDTTQSGPVQLVEVQVQDSRLTIDVDVHLSRALQRGRWQLGLMAHGVSSIEYRGPDGSGLDACCNFVRESNCKMKEYAELTHLHSEGLDKEFGWEYLQHDCPLGSRFAAQVDRPLHTFHDGLWTAVLELQNSDKGEEVFCAAAHFNVFNGTGM